MKQRLIAVLASLALLFSTLLAISFIPLPYVKYSPGPTVDVLGENDGHEIIEVSGHEVFRDDGQLRLTTVYLSPPAGGINLYTAMQGWLSDELDVYPYELVYPDDQTPEDADQESAVLMVGSQDAAIAAALTELGYDFTRQVEVQAVSPGMPAAGKLKVHDVLLRIGGTRIRSPQDVVDAVTGHAAGTPLDFRVRRGDKTVDVAVTPKQTDGSPKVGIVPGLGFDFPFDVTIGISPDIGGSSAGLMFSLAIYDTLTEGSLTDGEAVAGTGTIDEQGTVGPIGGIAQKVVGARASGADLFLVPPDNCTEALTADHGDMRLMRADDLESAIDGIESWADDPDAPLPTCEDTAGKTQERTP